MKRLLLAAALSALAASPAIAGKSEKKPEKKATIARSESCLKRFAALCSVMHRCAAGAEDMGKKCEAIDPGCDGLAGDAPYSAAEVDVCTVRLSTLSCPKRADPNDPKAMDFEGKVEACRKLVSADAELARRDERRRTATAAR